MSTRVLVMAVVVVVLGMVPNGVEPQRLQTLHKTNTTTTKWTRVSVTWLKWLSLPLTTDQAKREGWHREKRCNDRNFFRGYRYTLGKDRTVMLLFDKNQRIAGIQGGLPKRKVARKTLPWIRDRGHFVMTAYFRDPNSICSSNSSRPSSLGDHLLIQNGSSWRDHVTVPLHEQNLNGTKWVKGGCVWTMGRLYWYDISPRTACRDLFPVFLMYTNGELNGFGWVVTDKVMRSTFVHATSFAFKYFFEKGTMPECLNTAGLMSLQHIFLDDTPYLNIC